MRKALIFGVTGQDGSFLAEKLLAEQYEVHGVIRRSSTFNTSRIEHMQDKLKLHYGDILDSMSVFQLLSSIRPGEIYNLAAQSHVQVSFSLVQQTSQVDGFAVTNILEAMRQIPLPKSRLYQASTSEMFGGAEADYTSEDWKIILEKGMGERSAFHPKSPYAAGKLFAHNLVDIYRKSYGMFAVCGILFNHESHRRDPRFVTRKVTVAVARRAMGSREKLILGNLSARRDWFHASDAVSAMHSMLQQSEPTDFVVGSGQVYSVRDLVSLAFECINVHIVWKGEGVSEVGVSDETGEVLVMVDERYMRPNEVSFLKANPDKIARTLGWKPKITFQQMINDMVSKDIEALRGEDQCPARLPQPSIRSATWSSTDQASSPK